MLANKYKTKKKKDNWHFLENRLEYVHVNKRRHTEAKNNLIIKDVTDIGGGKEIKRQQKYRLWHVRCQIEILYMEPRLNSSQMPKKKLKLKLKA